MSSLRSESFAAVFLLAQKANMESRSLTFSATVREELRITHSGGGGSCRSLRGATQLDELDVAAIIAELEAHSTKIADAHSTVARVHDDLEARVRELRANVSAREQELRLLDSWPMQIADDAKKWLELWEGDFGRVSGSRIKKQNKKNLFHVCKLYFQRVLSSQNNQNVENALIVEQVGATVDYCRRYIYAKRSSHEAWRRSSAEMRSVYEV